MTNMKKLLAVVMAFAMLISMSGIAFAQTADESTPLVVGYANFSAKFSPFFADSAYDQDVASLVTGSIMTMDRVGGIVFNAIEGETISYNGTDYTYQGPANISVERDEASNTTKYTMKLREDLTFSDGQALTADDLIFSLYVLLDPAYDGSSTLKSYDIIGLQDYLTQTTSDIYTKYEAFADAIAEDGRDHVWADTDAYTKDQFDAYWASIDENWEAVCGLIKNYVVNGYLNDDYAATIGSTVDAIKDSDDQQTAFGMAMWGFAELSEDGATLTAGDGSTFDVANGVWPTMADFVTVTKALYENDATKFSGVEHPDQDAAFITGSAKNAFISAFAASEPELADGIKNIAGIKKVDDYTVEVTTNGFSAPAVYNICGFDIGAKHYYGDGTYDYDNNNFGHPYGDLTAIRAKDTMPMGHGPYKFIEYKDKIIYFEANENYFSGAPKIKYMQWKESLEADLIPGIVTATIDIANPSFSKSVAENISGLNPEGTVSGSVISTSLVDNRGYGYIGINADTVRVGDQSASTESKYLRTAFAMLFSAYRETIVDSYYGPAASVINYPISNTSWAAPQTTDEDYKVAFSTKLDGSSLFTEDMDAPAKEAAALEGAIEYFKAAGYTFDDATGKFTAAPEGAKMIYEIIIPADGQGNHPSFGILTGVKNALETIGITLEINDPADSNVLWNSLDAGTQNMWCAAWQSTVDPDMHQIYHSSGITGRGGSESNRYHLDDSELDKLIMDARESDDQNYRKQVYKTALDIVIDWAVEVPVYQRQNAISFSTERIKMDTVTPDITTFYGWMSEIENMEMN